MKTHTLSRFKIFIILLFLFFFIERILDLKSRFSQSFELGIPNPFFSSVRIWIKIEETGLLSIVSVTLREFSIDSWFFKIPQSTIMQIPLIVVLGLVFWTLAGLAYDFPFFFVVSSSGPTLLGIFYVIERLEEPTVSLVPLLIPPFGILLLVASIEKTWNPTETYFEQVKKASETIQNKVIQGVLFATLSVKGYGWFLLYLWYQTWLTLASKLKPRMPGFNPVVNGLCISTWLALCTLGLLSKVLKGLGMQVPVFGVGMFVVALSQMGCGCFYVVNKRWPGKLEFLEYSNSVPLWPLFFLATVIPFLSGLGDMPFMPAIVQYKSVFVQTYLSLSLVLIGIYLGLVHLLHIKQPAFPITPFWICFGLLCIRCFLGIPGMCSYDLGKEYIPGNLEEFAKLENNTPKSSHACVTGSFSVSEDLTPENNVGIFRAGRNYPALVQFSSIRFPDSSHSDSSITEMTIKLLDTDRQNQLDKSFTQDFSLISQPIFYARSAEEFSIMQNITRYGIYEHFDWIFPSWKPWTWNVQSALTVASFDLMNFIFPTTNLLNTKYYSSTSYAFNSKRQQHAVKYFAKPCDGTFSKTRELSDKQHARTHSQTYLRDNLVDFLNHQDACFHFYIQKQNRACTSDNTNSVEDSSRLWTSHMTKIATVIIPMQIISLDQMDYCAKKLVFNPWNSMEEHKPLGAVNFMRKPVLDHITVKNVNSKDFQTFNLSRGTLNLGNTVDYQYEAYEEYPDMPKKIKNMIPEFHFSLGSIAKLVGEHHSYMESVEEVQEPFRSFDDYGSILHTREPVLIQQSWKLDEIFARQFVAGMNPVVITAYDQQLRRFPEIFNLEALMKAHGIYGWRDSAKFMEEKKLFFADYEMLQGVRSLNNRAVIYAPIVVFYLNEDNILMPLGIQLTRSGVNDRVYTPADPELAWLFARMHAMQADGLVHELVYHLCYTHLVMESVLIAVNRQLPQTHAVWKLLTPHFRETIAINHLGRNTLLDSIYGKFDTILATGIAAGVELMNKSFVGRYHFMERSFKRDMEARGFYEVKEGMEDNLPGYLYRDDGFVVWNALYEFVHGVLSQEYENDESIRKDYVLQGLKHELEDPSLGNIPGIPNLDSIDSVTEFLTAIMYTASAQHQALGSAQYSFYGFIPNRPLCISKGIPDNLTVVTESWTVEALPPLSQAKETAGHGRSLSAELHPNLMELDVSVPHEWEVHQNRMQQKFKELAKKVNARKEKDFPAYVFLDPARIPAAISS